MLKFITSNSHKFEELGQYFGQFNIEVKHLNYKYTELQADTTREVVSASATTLSTVIDGDFIIEDSGLFIDRLKGFPGPYSSFVYQTIGWQGILDLLKDNKDREARFVSIFALVMNKRLYLFEGECMGKISHKGRGKLGFGFDPIFIPILKNSLNDKTFAQLDTIEKNTFSHRAKSMAKLVDFLLNA